jgi:hypothetical protein
MDYWDLSKPLQERLRIAIQQKRVDVLAQRIKSRLEDAGWSTETPGVVTSASKMYTFDVLAKGPNKSQVAIDFVINESINNKIIERSNMVSDLGSSNYFIASIRPFRTEDLRLAELYRIKIIYSETEEGLISSVLNTIIK